MTLRVPEDGCCTGHACDDCPSCLRGHCCRKDNPNYHLPKVGDWQGTVYGKIGVRNVVGDDMECHACGLFFRGVGPHAYQAHDLLSAEYKAIFGLIKKRGLMADTMRERHSLMSKQKWDDGTMSTVHPELLLSPITPERRLAMRQEYQFRVSIEERLERAEHFRRVGRAWKGRQQSAEHLRKRTESRMRRAQMDVTA